MLNIKLDKFKKIDSDGNSSTLISPKGEKIKIAHSLLSEKMREQIKKIPMHLADGGGIGEEESPDKIVDGENRPIEININTPTSQAPQEINPNQEMVQNAPEYKPENVEQSSPPPIPQQSNIINQNSQMSVPENNSMPTSMPGQESMPSNPLMDHSYGQQYLKGLSEQKAAGAQEGMAIQQLGKAEMEAANQQAMQTAAIKKLYEDKINYKQQQIDEISGILADKENGHIKANNYLQNQTTSQKIGTAIGLILGGIGGGLTHQENPVLKFLNSQIDRDITSQRDNINNQQTLMGAYMKQFGNIKDAETMAYATQNAIYATDLKAAAAKSMDAQGKARLLNAASLFDQQAGKYTDELAQRRAQFGLTQALQSGQANQNLNVEMLPPDIRKRIVPLPTGGMALAYDEHEAGDVKKSFTNLTNLKGQIQRMRDFQQNVGRTAPYSDNDKQAEDMREAMVLTLNQLHDLKRLNDNEFIANKGLVPNVGAIRQGRVSQQLQNLDDLINLKMKEEYQNHLQGMNKNTPHSLEGSKNIKVGAPVFKGK